MESLRVAAARTHTTVKLNIQREARFSLLESLEFFEVALQTLWQDTAGDHTRS